MSGETEQQVSGWTVDTLKEYLEGLLEAKDLRDEQRFIALQRAIDIATEASEKRFEGVNEFRQQLGDQARTFLPRLEYDRAHDDLIHRVDQNAQQQGARLTKLERVDDVETARRGGGLATWGYIVGVVGILLGVAGFVVGLAR